VAPLVLVVRVKSSPEIVKSPVTVRLRPIVTSLFASSNINLLAGTVQNTSFVPALKSTALSLLEEDITVVRVRSELSPSSVPKPTSNSA
jgi:hypothetical protein